MQYLHLIKSFMDSNTYLILLVLLGKIFKVFTLIKNVFLFLYSSINNLFKKNERKFFLRKIRLMFSGFEVPQHLKKSYKKAYWTIKHDTIRALYWIHSEPSKNLVASNLKQDYIYELSSLGLIKEVAHKVRWGGHPPMTVTLTDLGILLCKNLNPNFEIDFEEFNRPIRPVSHPKWTIDPLDISIYSKIDKWEIADLLFHLKKYENLNIDKQNEFKRYLDTIIANLKVNVPLDKYYEYKKKIIEL
jgi:hypothetical protein